jgi:Family of unknown function (DUF6221)
MDDLIAFLRARLDEDEATADGLQFACRLPDKVPDFTACGGPAAEAYWRHFDPARVLREVAAGRLLLRQFELRGNSVRATVQPPTGGVWDDLLRMLALPYADHPDYRPEWKP